MPDFSPQYKTNPHKMKQAPVKYESQDVSRKVLGNQGFPKWNPQTEFISVEENRASPNGLASVPSSVLSLKPPVLTKVKAPSAGRAVVADAVVAAIAAAQQDQDPDPGGIAIPAAAAVVIAEQIQQDDDPKNTAFIATTKSTHNKIPPSDKRILVTILSYEVFCCFLPVCYFFILAGSDPAR